MNTNNPQPPDPEFIAQQLRKPSGDFAQKIGQKMNQVNKPLYDLTFDLMKTENACSILEIGFGTGKFFSQLFDGNDAIQVSGIDYSKEMVESAKEYNREFISKKRLILKLGNSASIPFPDDSFDTVFCNMVIYFWGEPEKHLNEIRRVLKPEGLFYTGMRTKDSMLGFPFVEHGFNLYSIRQWKKILSHNGFKTQETYKRMDPEIEIKEQDKKNRLKSCCIIAKNSASNKQEHKQ